MNVSTTAKTEAALEYIAMGFPVIPLCWPTQDGTCGCGRGHEGKSIGKVPLTDHGLKDATQTQTGVKEYWEKWPNANVAIVIPEGHFVLDVDAEHGGYESLEILQEQYVKLPKTLTAMTGGGGIHIWFKAKDIRNTTALAGFPGLDVRGVGGYVVAPPSIHRSGKEYAWIDQSPIADAPEWLVKLCVNNHHSNTSVLQIKENWITQAMPGVTEGQRDAVCTRLAGYFLTKMPPDIVREVLYPFADRCTPPLAHADVDKCVDSVSRKERTKGEDPNTGDKDIYHYCPPTEPAISERYKSVTESVTNLTDGQQPMKSLQSQGIENVTKEQPSVTESLAKRIEDWVKDSSGWFSYDDIDKEFGIHADNDKLNRRVIIKRLKDANVIEQHIKNNKLYRYINTSVRLIDFKSGNKVTPIQLKYPFGIEYYFNTYPGNIIVVAGSPDAGKTAFLLNLIRMNQFDFSIYYQSSEMGKDELQNRLLNFEGIDVQDWNFTAEERSSNFADVIRPNCVNIIDYMELSGDFYMVAEYLRQIHDKLDGGIAIVALQKDPKAPQGRGGTFGLEKPRLYLNMDSGQILIRKAKNWTHPEQNPNGLILNYKIVGGCKFIITNDWHNDGGTK
jgi:hypothetical protein